MHESKIHIFWEHQRNHASPSSLTTWIFNSTCWRLKNFAAGMAGLRSGEALAYNCESLRSNPSHDRLPLWAWVPHINSTSNLLKPNPPYKWSGGALILTHLLCPVRTHNLHGSKQVCSPSPYHPFGQSWRFLQLFKSRRHRVKLWQDSKEDEHLRLILSSKMDALDLCRDKPLHCFPMQ